MDLHITIKTARALRDHSPNTFDKAHIPSWRLEKGNSKPTDNVEVDLDDMEVDELEALRTVMAENEEASTRTVSQLINLLKNPENRKVVSLADFPKALTTYLRAQAHPWLFSLSAEDRAIAYLPLRVLYCSEDRSHRRDPFVQFVYCNNSKNAFHENQKNLHSHDVVGLTIPQTLKRLGFMVPTDEQIQDYEKVQARYLKYVAAQGEQFYVRNKGYKADRGKWWESPVVTLSLSGRPTKAVVDMDSVAEGRNTARSTMQSVIYEGYRKVPEHPMIHMWSMTHHENVWVSVANMKPYVYEKGIAERLVLPKSHTRLIGALVSNLEVLQVENEAEDRSRTIRNKAKSSIILAKGPAGTGKTLTAEVYAEQIERPLYEIQSGQLGTDPESIETNLHEILQRSTRLRMPLLINEADVFIKARGDDMLQNAVVSVFLRLMEYHDGLVFLTTNRAQDVDEAFLSRCIATISYSTPGETERTRLWKMLSAEFNVSLSDKEIVQLVRVMPKIVGRDIQNLIRLTSRVCVATNTPFSVEALCDNAVFRDVQVLTEKRP